MLASDVTAIVGILLLAFVWDYYPKIGALLIAIVAGSIILSAKQKGMI